MMISMILHNQWLHMISSQWFGNFTNYKDLIHKEELKRRLRSLRLNYDYDFLSVNYDSLSVNYGWVRGH